MKGNKWTIAAVGLAAALAAYFLMRKKAQAAALPSGSEPATTPEAVVEVPEITLTSEAVADATPTPPPGRTSQSTIEQTQQPYDGQAVIDSYLRAKTQSATRDLATEQVKATAQSELQSALARGGSSAAAPVNLLSKDTADLKKRREAYRGVIKAAADLLQKAGVSGSGCGILDAARALALDPFGVPVERMAGVLDTIEQKVSKEISQTRKDATFRTISAMTDPIAICFALTVQISSAAADVAKANARVTANPATTANLVGRRIADALKVACQGATQARASAASASVTFDAGKAASTVTTPFAQPSLKIGTI